MENSHEHRMLCRLDAIVTYITFQSAGQHELYAIMLSSDNANGSDLAKYTEREGEQYTYRLYNRGGQRIEKKFTVSGGADTRPIHVALEFFAKKPPQWLTFWCNLWFETKPRDQCHLRRRALTAFTVQPFVIAAWLIARTIIGLIGAVFVVSRGKVPGPVLTVLLHPWKQSLKSIWWYRPDWPIFDGRGWTELLRPTTWSAIGMILLCIQLLLQPTMQTMISILGSIIGVVIVASVCVIGFGKLQKSFPFSKFLDKRANRKRQQELKMRLLARRNMTIELQPLLCNQLPLSGKLTDIPAEKQTLLLRFSAFKAQVCKPFAT
ncbi:MAG: hypothetical protein AAB515_00075 [Patescibacteria group bacterium]